MSSTRKSIASAVSVALALSAGAATSQAAELTRDQLQSLRQVFSPNHIEIDKTCPAGTKVKVIRIRVGSSGDFRVKSPSRHIRVKGFNTAGDDEDDKAGSDPGEPTLKPQYHKTKFDIDVYPYLKKAGDKVLIKIKLMDDQMSFLDPVGEKAVSSVTATTEYGHRLFCDLGKVTMNQHDTESRRHPQVIFWATYLDEMGSTAPFNVNVIVHDDDGVHTLPIIIDPSVKNEG